MKSTWVEVDLGVLKENILRARKSLGPRPDIIFVVKDRAYGHGLAPVVRAAAAAGVKWFGVVDLSEALEVQAVDPSVRILVLGRVEPEDIVTLEGGRIVPVILSEEHGRVLSDAANVMGLSLSVHLKIDTGMGRLGVPWEDAADIASRLAEEGGLDICGVCTHFASVEMKKPSLAAEQRERFEKACVGLAERGFRNLFRHVSSSRAFLYRAEWDMDAVRPGIALYGYGTNESNMRFKTRPILQWKAPVVQVKKVPAGFTVGYYSTYQTTSATTIATIAVGYADGYHRALSNKGFVLLRGRRCPVVGRVSMNWITADAGPDSEVQAGDEAVLIGQQGSESIWASELARLARTIPYELLTSINPLAVREYTG